MIAISNGLVTRMETNSLTMTIKNLINLRKGMKTFFPLSSPLGKPTESFFPPVNEDTLIHLNNPHSDIEQLWFRVSVAENADLGGWAERKWICGIVFLAEKKGPSLIPMWTLLLNLMEDRVFLDFWNSKGIPTFSFYITWKMSFPHELQKSTTRKITLTSNLLLKAWFHKYTWSLTKHVSVVKA